MIKSFGPETDPCATPHFMFMCVDLCSAVSEAAAQPVQPNPSDTIPL